MAGVTSPDNISFADTSDPQNLPAITSAMASSIQAALSVRQERNFKWANAAARNAQSNAVIGDQGLQFDTLTLYFFDGNMWRPYAGQMPLLQVGKTSGGLVPAASTGATVVALDTTTLTRGDVTTFYTFTGGQININVAGFYRLYFGVEFSNPSTTDTTRRQARLLVSGNIVSVASVANNTSGPQTTVASNVYVAPLLPGQYVQLAAGHGYSSAIAANNQGTVLAIEYVGA